MREGSTTTGTPPKALEADHFTERILGAVIDAMDMLTVYIGTASATTGRSPSTGR